MINLNFWKMISRFVIIFCVTKLIKIQLLLQAIMNFFEKIEIFWNFIIKKKKKKTKRKDTWNCSKNLINWFKVAGIPTILLCRQGLRMNEPLVMRCHVSINSIKEKKNKIIPNCYFDNMNCHLQVKQ